MNIDMIEPADDFNSPDNSYLYEEFYWDVLDKMSDLIVSYGRDRVMTDCTELVLSKLQELQKENLV